MKRTTAARWATHNIIGKRAKTEFWDQAWMKLQWKLFLMRN